MSDAGLCDSCRHRRIVRSDRGSRFLLCRRSKEDSRFPRYPRLPVLACAGHEPGVTGRSSGPAGPSEPAG